MAMVEDVVVVVDEEMALATVEDVADAATMASMGARNVVFMRCCCCCRHLPSELTRLCFCFSLHRCPLSHLPSTMPFSSSLACLSDCCVYLCLARPGLKRLARSVAMRSNSGAPKFRPASGSGAPRFQPVSALARQGSGRPQALTRQGSGQPLAPVGLGLRRAEVLARLGLRAWAPVRRGSGRPRVLSPRLWRVKVLAGLGLWRSGRPPRQRP